MREIPSDERMIEDEEVFRAFDLHYPGLQKVKEALDSGDTGRAKRELLVYFEKRGNVFYYYDYRQLPMAPIETDSNPYLFQSSMGLQGSLKEFCLFAGRKIMRHIYVRPGRERRELYLGADYENLPHFNFFEDQGKKHRTTLDIFVRGIFMEYLSILYHESGEREILAFSEEFLPVFQENYPLIVTEFAPDTSHFSKLEERDVMSVGFLTLNYIALLYTRLPYDMDTETAFGVVKHLWFLGMQFRRFDTDTYRKYNHHLFERGLVPFILGTLFPEIPEFAGMKERGADVVRRHVRDDFNEEGGYNEHTISYWCGAALSEMLCRGMYLARLNREPLLDEDTRLRISKSYDILALISAPGECYPSLGDNGATCINPVLQAGAAAGNRLCGEVLARRLGGGDAQCTVPLDYCSDRTGYFCSKSGHGPDADYILMSTKVNCGDTGHNHMDLLSVFVSIHGQEMIGEPYARELYHTACVGSGLRGYLYNMGSHNTVLAFGSPIQPDEIYASKWGVLRPDTPVAMFASTKEGCYVRAYHDAYTHSRHVRRILSCRKRGFLIRDELIGGNRLQKESIQRWHLFPDVRYEQTGERSVILEKNGAKALLLWGGAPVLRFWRKEELYPPVVSRREDIAVVIDAGFKEASFSPAGRIASVFQDLLILDVTEYMPVIEEKEIDGWFECLMQDAEEDRLSGALKRFGELC